MKPPNKSKKLSVFVAVFILFAGIAIGGFLVLKSKSGSASISRQIGYLLSREESDEAQGAQDSDNDGLKDWEEKLYGSDPKNPDTDKDGYLDGEEVAAGYDPTKKAPDDALTGGKAKNPRPLPGNLTKALGAKLGEAIAKGKIKLLDSAGNPLAAEELERQAGVNEALLGAAHQQLPEFSLVQISDNEIVISDKSGRDQTLNYLEILSNVLPKLPLKESSEMEFFINAMENNDVARLEEFGKIYLKSHYNLKKIAAPRDLVVFHKGLIAVFLATSNIYNAIKNVDQDPLRAAIALNQYTEIDRQTNELIKNLFEQVNRYNR